MRIVLVHNRYQQSGGEDAVFAAEAALLRRKGHEVVEFTDDNCRIQEMSQAAVAVQAVWSRSSHHRLRNMLAADRCDVAHFHNTFPLISPAAYYACRELDVPVVQTLHNYRLFCPAALFFRDGHRCEECLDKTLPWPGVLHACYRQSRLQTAAVVAMLTFHRWLKTWHQQVDRYIALTEFARQKFIEGGLPAGKTVVKPNFIDPDPGVSAGQGRYAVFVGRLAPEKGIRILMRAWQRCAGIHLRIVGDGPLMNEVVAFVRERKLGCVEVMGRRSRPEVLALIREARLLVFPSEYYECFPVTIAESFACGVPVVASRLGAMAEIIREGQTGLLFAPGDPDDLASKVTWAFSQTAAMSQMGGRARKEFEEKYRAERNYEMLMNIYHSATERARTHEYSFEQTRNAL